MKERNYKSSIRVGKVEKVQAAAREFAGRYELNGRFDEDGFYYGTRGAVAQVAAFCDGYFKCLSDVGRTSAS